MSSVELPDRAKQLQQKRANFPILTIDDLPEKLSYIDLTAKIMAEDDPDFGGFKTLFEDFYEEGVRKELDQVLSNTDDKTLMDDYIMRVSEYVMRKLYSTIWTKDSLTSPEDKAYSEKQQMLTWVEPQHIDLPDAPRTVNKPMWGVSANFLKLIEEARMNDFCKQLFGIREEMLGLMERFRNQKF